MQAALHTSGSGGRERRRVEAVVGTLARTPGESETLADLAHDARNMVTALALYCELLDDPGVLTEGFLHYAQELKLVTAASRRLVEKLVLLDQQNADRQRDAQAAGATLPALAAQARALASTRGEARKAANPAAVPAEDASIQDLRQEVLANRNLLDAMAGLGIEVTVSAPGGACPVRLTGEDLTRVLVNLVKNAAEAMRAAGTIHITLDDGPDGEAGGEPEAVLTVEDSGPGIPAENLETIFEPGFTTSDRSQPLRGWPAVHRGLGLSISRSIVEAAGGRISVHNRPEGGACFTILLPRTQP